MSLVVSDLDQAMLAAVNLKRICRERCAPRPGSSGARDSNFSGHICRIARLMRG